MANGDREFPLPAELAGHVGEGSPRPSRNPFRRIAGYTSLRGNIAANYGGRLWEAAMSIAFVPLYIAHLGTEAYGIIGIVAVIQAFMLILDFGMTPTLTREAARFGAGEHTALHIKDLIRSVEWIVLGLCLTIAAGIALAAPFIAGHWVHAERLNPEVIARALTIAGALIALRFFESIYRGTLYGLQRQLLCNAIAAVAATLRGGGAALLIVAFGAGLRGFFAWQVAVSLLTVLMMRTSVHLALPQTERHGRFSPVAVRTVWRFATGMVLISLLSLAATQSDKFVLSRILPLREFGYYVFAANLGILLELISAPIMTALYPQIVDCIGKSDDTRLESLFHRWTTIVATMTAPMAALLVFFAPMLILAWSNNPALSSHSGPLLSILAIGTFIHAQCVLPYYVQLGYGWTRLGIWTNAGALVVTVPSLLFLVPRFGTSAAPWVWVTVACIYFISTLLVMFSRYLRGARTRFLVMDVGAPSAAAFAVMALCSRLLTFLPATFFGRVATLGIALGLALAAAASCAFLMRGWAVRKAGTVATAS